MKTRRILSLVVVLLFFTSLLLTGDDRAVEVKGDEYIPLYEPVCGSFRSHDMYGRGIGSITHVASNTTYYGQAWQCSRCYMCLVTEGNPTWVYPYQQYIGHYAEEPCLYPITTNVLAIFTNSVHYCACFSLPEYHFN